jgi:cytochrome o ubiquinol oxidase subunit II
LGLFGLRVARRGVFNAATAVPLFALCACHEGVLVPQGPVGGAENQILFNALVVMLMIVVPTILATLGFAWWFRAGNTRARRLPEWAYSGRIELVTWSIPVLVIFFLGGLAWTGSHDLDPAKPLAGPARPLDVQVVALDWKWLFIYPGQQVASVNELVIPQGTPVRFALTSASVMNAFFVPQLGSMIYVMNGMSTQLNLQADQAGVFRGLSSHFSGDGFSDMHFNVRSVSQQDFQAWVAGALATGPALDQAAYTELSKQTSSVAPFTYRSVEPGLYDAVVTQKLPPGPGPQFGRPTPDVSPRREG